MIEITQLLSDETIHIIDRPNKKSDLLKTLIDAMTKSHPEISSKSAFQAVMEREKVSSTSLESGLAVPHARLSNLNGIVASLGIIPEGMEDPKAKNIKIQFVFLFLSPQQEFAAHLQTLSRASWLFQNQILKENLLKEKDVKAILKLIRDAEKEIPNGSTA